MIEYSLHNRNDLLEQVKIPEAAVLPKIHLKRTADFCMQLMGEVQLLPSPGECLDPCPAPPEEFSAYLKAYTEV